jgi:hypothetical protein
MLVFIISGCSNINTKNILDRLGGFDVSVNVSNGQVKAKLGIKSHRKAGNDKLFGRK